MPYSRPREGVIGRLTGGHRDAYQALNDWLGKLADPTLRSVAQAISDSANYYEHTDQASAQKLDGTYPAADADAQRKKTGYVTSEAGTPVEFQNVQEPRGRLNDPRDYHAELNGDYDWWDSASPMTGDRRSARGGQPRGALAGRARPADRPLGRDRQAVGR